MSYCSDVKKDYQRTDFNKAFDAPIQDPDLEEVSEQFFNEAPLNAYKNIPRNFDFKNHMPSLVKLFPKRHAGQKGSSFGKGANLFTE